MGSSKNMKSAGGSVESHHLGSIDEPVASVCTSQVLAESSSVDSDASSAMANSTMKKQQQQGGSGSAHGRTMPKSDRNASLSWSDIMRYGDGQVNSCRDMNNQEAPSSHLIIDAIDGRDRAGNNAKLLQSNNGAPASPLCNSSTSRMSKRGSEQQQQQPSTSTSRVAGASHKVDTWRPESPKFKRKEDTDTKVLDRSASRMAEPETTLAAPAQAPRRHTIMVKDCETSMSCVSSVISTNKVSTAETSTLVFERPPSPTVNKLTEILPKVDTWRGDRSPDARRRKMMQVHADIGVGTENNNSIGLQACSLDFLVSVEAEVKPDVVPSSPSAKKSVAHKVDTRWKDGVIPRRNTESFNAASSSGQFQQTMDIDTLAAPLESDQISKDEASSSSAVCDQPSSSADNGSVEADVRRSSAAVYQYKRHVSIVAPIINATAATSSDFSSSSALSSPVSSSPCNVYQPKRQVSISHEERRQSLAPLATGRMDASQSSRSETFSRPSSPILRKRQTDSAIAATPSPATATVSASMEASVDDIDAYMASSPMEGSMRQSALTQRNRAAYLMAGKHVPAMSDSTVGPYAATVLDGSVKDAVKPLRLPIQIASTKGWSNHVSSLNVPAIILLVFILAVFQLLTGDSSLRYHQNCSQIESAYSNSGQVVCLRH